MSLRIVIFYLAAVMSLPSFATAQDTETKLRGYAQGKGALFVEAPYEGMEVFVNGDLQAITDSTKSAKIFLDSGRVEIVAVIELNGLKVLRSKKVGFIQPGQDFLLHFQERDFVSELTPAGEKAEEQAILEAQQRREGEKIVLKRNALVRVFAEQIETFKNSNALRILLFYRNLETRQECFEDETFKTQFETIHSRRTAGENREIESWAKSLLDDYGYANSIESLLEASTCSVSQESSQFFRSLQSEQREIFDTRVRGVSAGLPMCEEWKKNSSFGDYFTRAIDIPEVAHAVGAVKVWYNEQNTKIRKGSIDNRCQTLASIYDFK